MSDIYHQIIDNIISPKFPLSEIAIEIAKTEPTVFMEAIASLALNVPWRKEIESLLAVGLKIEAIKLWRGKTGTSLKDAKDAVDAVAQGLGK